MRRVFWRLGVFALLLISPLSLFFFFRILDTHFSFLLVVALVFITNNVMSICIPTPYTVHVHTLRFTGVYLGVG